MSTSRLGEQDAIVVRGNLPVVLNVVRTISWFHEHRELGSSPGNS
jgi:hypothetical protein